MARSRSGYEHQHDPQPQLSQQRLEQARRHAEYQANYQIPHQSTRPRLEIEVNGDVIQFRNTEKCRNNAVTGSESPEALRSGGSCGYANSLATSFVTTTTTELEQQRQISPVIGTPTSSNSSIVYAYRKPNSSNGKIPERRHVVDKSYRSRTSSRRALSPVAAAGVLAGIDAEQSLPPTNHFLQQHIEYAERLGPYPGRQQRFPHSAQTWTGGYPFRHEDPMIIDSEPISPVTSHSLPPSSSSLSPPEANERVGGKRTRPLTAEQRINASQVRQLGACLRCQYMKETCDQLTPCNNCQNKKTRKWRCGCRRLPLHKYTEFILPDVLAQKLRWPDWSGYIHKQMMWYAADTRNPPFELWLANGLGKDEDDIEDKCLIVLVREIEPTHLTEPNQRAYTTTSSCGENQIRSVDLTNPPIAPYLTDRQQQAQFQRHFKQIRYLAERTVEDRTSDWPWDCFQRLEENWLGFVLDTIHNYYRRDLESHQALRTALHLPFFNYLLCHPFEVPRSKVAELYQRLHCSAAHEALPSGPVCPDTVNRYLKSIVYKLTEEAVEKTLEHLHKLLKDMATNRSNTTATADLAFCLAFILLYFLGQTQHTVLLQALKVQFDPQPSPSRLEAERFIHKMESELGDYIVYFCAYTFSRRQGPSRSTNVPPNSDDAHALTFKLMDRVKSISIDNAQCKPSSLELSEIDPNRFEIENPTRLCWKFYKAIS